MYFSRQVIGETAIYSFKIMLYGAERVSTYTKDEEMLLITEVTYSSDVEEQSEEPSDTDVNLIEKTNSG